MRVTWNLTDKRRKYNQADVLVLSVAKSGRTWLRVLLAKYLSLHFGVEMSIEDRYGPAAGMPKIMYGHERWSHLVESTVSRRLFGRYIVPEAMARRKRIVMFYRDPRDVVVSLYFEKTKRADRKVSMTLPDFIRDPVFGIDCIINVMNDWHRRFDGWPNCLWKNYEGLKADTGQVLHDILDFIGVTDIRNDYLEEAIDYAKFENMKKLEARDSFNTPILRPGNSSDPDSFKVREGKVGGFVKHFDREDLDYLNQRMSYLDSFFDYPPTA